MRNFQILPSIICAMALFVTACESTPGQNVPQQQVPDIGLPPVMPPVQGPIVTPPAPVPQPVQPSGLTPDFMQGQEDIRRIAVLLPLSHPNRNVRAEAESMLAGIQMALFDHGDESILLLPKDTHGSRPQAESAAREALGEGAEIILGPLFSDNVQAVSRIASADGAEVIAFSNNREAASGGAYLASIAPEEEVKRVVRHAVNEGISGFAFFGPNSEYGRRVEAAFRLEVNRSGRELIGSTFYDPSNDQPVDQAQSLAGAVSAYTNSGQRAAVMIPEQGIKLRTAATLLPYYGISKRRVRFLGTSLWNDPSVWREPALSQGWYAAPDPADVARYAERYQRLFGHGPSRLSSVAYDAASMTIGLAGEDRLDRVGLVDPAGFQGVNGLFRFRGNGTTERALAILTIDPDQGAIVEVPSRQDFAGES